MINVKEVKVFTDWCSVSHEEEIQNIIQDVVDSQELKQLDKHYIKNKLNLILNNIEYFSKDEFYNFANCLEIEPEDLVNGCYTLKNIFDLMLEDILDNLKIECAIIY